MIWLGQSIALVRDIGDLFQIFCVSCIVGRNGPVGVYEALSAQFAERRIKLLVVLRQLDEVLLALLDPLRQGARHKPLGQNAPVVNVAVLQAQQRHHRRTNVSVIGEHGVVAAEVPNTGPDCREPCARNILLEVAMVPGEGRSRRYRNGDAGRTCHAVASAGCEEEVVIVAEHGERRRACQTLGHHVQEFHLGLIRQKRRQLIDVAGDRVGGHQRV